MVTMTDCVMIKVTKGDKPIRGVTVYYVEQNGNSGDAATDSDGCAILPLVGPVLISLMTFTVEGTKHEYPEKHLTKGVNEFHF